MEQLSFFESHREERLLEQMEQDFIRRGLYLESESRPKEFKTGIFVMEDCDFMEVEGLLPLLDITKKDGQTKFQEEMKQVVPLDFASLQNNFQQEYDAFLKALKDVKDAKKKKRLLETQLKNAEKQVDWLKKENKAQKEEIEALKKRELQLQKNEAEKKEDVSRLKKQILTLQKQAQPHRAKALEAESRKEEYAEKMAHLSIETTLSNRIFHPSKYQEVSEEMEKLQKSFTEMEELEKQESLKADDYEEKISILQQECMEVESFLATLAFEISSTKVKLQETSLRFEKGSQAISKVEQRNRTTKNRILNSEEEIESRNDQQILARRSCAKAASLFILAYYQVHQEEENFGVDAQLLPTFYTRYLRVSNLSDVNQGYTLFINKKKVGKEDARKFVSVLKMED